MPAAESQEAPVSKDPIVAAFTPREQNIIINIMASFSELPAIDNVKVADRMGFKNPRSIGNAWSIIKRKIHAINKDLPSDNEGEAEAAGPATKRARTAKGKAPAAGAKAAPTKRARKGRAQLADSDGDDEEDEQAPAKARKVATPRIRVKKSVAPAADESHGDAGSEAEGIV
ncbi:hypothetical protein BT67DRAFT_432812 [Trichocladium antarcticum]|uniref:Uncharacterized protein n=1 Tax=Trichocladium antarcticum TaxID=1450529 RepID=A0AAN6UNL1_9PEZI|nr:hypothetical protein BT67DRAFT_432812 [Trichocladium antarcticum]